MIATDRAVQGLRLGAALSFALGIGLAVAGTLGVEGSIGGLAVSRYGLVVGLGVLPLGVALVAASVALAGDRGTADAVVVIGCMWLHLGSLAIVLLAALYAVAFGGRWAPAFVWAGASACYLLGSWGWDRLSETDVDAVLERAEWYP